MSTYAAYGVEPLDETIHEFSFDVPVPQGNQVLIRVTHSGVCHTDTHLREGGYDLGSLGKSDLRERVEYPIIMGHETVGEVVSMGDTVTGIEAGKTYLVFPWVGCGECSDCYSGDENRCPKARALGIAQHGGYADYLLVPDAKYLVDIQGLDPSWAATLACSGLTAFSAVNKISHLAPEEPIAVCGAGGLGLTAISILSHLGFTHVIAIDVNANNLDIAQKMGARDIVFSNDEAVEQLRQIAPQGVSAVLDFVNNGATAAMAFRALRKGGTMIQIGLFGGEFVIPNATLALQMIRIQGSYVGNLNELRALVELAKSNPLPQLPLDLRELNRDNVESALNDLVNRKVSGRVVLVN